MSGEAPVRVRLSRRKGWRLPPNIDWENGCCAVRRGKRTYAGLLARLQARDPGLVAEVERAAAARAERAARFRTRRGLH